MAQAAPEDVAARAAPLFDRLRRVEAREEDDLVVIPRLPLSRAEPPRAACMMVVFANMVRSLPAVVAQDKEQGLD